MISCIYPSFKQFVRNSPSQMVNRMFRLHTLAQTHTQNTIASPRGKYENEKAKKKKKHTQIVQQNEHVIIELPDDKLSCASGNF